MRKAAFEKLGFEILLRIHLNDRFWTAAAAAAKLLQSYMTMCNPTDGSPPGSPIPGILQTRTPEWVNCGLMRIYSR